MVLDNAFDKLTVCESLVMLEVQPWQRLKIVPRRVTGDLLRLSKAVIPETIDMSSWRQVRGRAQKARYDVSAVHGPLHDTALQCMYITSAIF